MSILVKHLRDGEGRPFGTMVAINRHTIGVTLHSKPGFVKSNGVLIAQGRAEKNPGLNGVDVPNVYVFDGMDYVPMSDLVLIEYNQMLNRARRYFK